jgi:YHS domain-containing protein
MMDRDPVCGMDIIPQDAAATREHMGQTFYFCSFNCVEQFDANPHRFASSARAATDGALPAGSATTGFNPALPLTRINLPVLGLEREQAGRAVEVAVVSVAGVHRARANVSSGRVVSGPMSSYSPKMSHQWPNLTGN